MGPLFVVKDSASEVRLLLLFGVFGLQTSSFSFAGEKGGVFEGGDVLSPWIGGHIQETRQATTAEERIPYWEYYQADVVTEYITITTAGHGIAILVLMSVRPVTRA